MIFNLIELSTGRLFTKLNTLVDNFLPTWILSLMTFNLANWNLYWMTFNLAELSLMDDF